MKSVEDLDVFKLAHQLALKTYSVTQKFREYGHETRYFCDPRTRDSFDAKTFIEN